MAEPKHDFPTFDLTSVRGMDTITTVIGKSIPGDSRLFKNRLSLFQNRQNWSCLLTSSAAEASGGTVNKVSADLMNLASARRRRRHRWLAVVTLLGATFNCILVAKVVFDWPAARDPVPREVQQAAVGRPDLVGRADVYDCWGNFIDKQHLWRVEVGPEVIPAIVRECELRELIAAGDVPDAFWRQLPYRWRPPRAGPARYFVSSGFQADKRGRDGSHYLMAYDEAGGVLYVWHKDNF